MNEPLIYTVKGNLPEKDLRYDKTWEVNEDFIVFREFWHDATGDLVKNNVHMYAMKGLPSIGAAQAQM